MPIDVERQVKHWRHGALEDLEAARDLVARGHHRHGLFFAHLALEKLLKAHICRDSAGLPPRIHNLVRLVQQTSFEPAEEHLDVLAEMNAFNIEGRYPEHLLPAPTPGEAARYLERTEEVFGWLNRQW